MKKLMKKASLVLSAVVVALCLTACDETAPVEPTIDWENLGVYAPVDQVTDTTKLAQGAKSYVAASYEEREKILGLLEQYAVENHLTGMTMYEDGGYVMYSEDVVKGTNTFIPGYGFGITTEGYIKNPLAFETVDAWKKYYHSYQTEDPKAINYMDDKGSVVGGLIGYTSASYWTTQMNANKDGYEWVPELAVSNRPIAVNPDNNGLATTYKLEVKVGSDAKYGTNTANSTLSKYNGQEVKLEDYITPYKIYYTQAYGMARGSEKLTGAGSIAGSANYYNKSKDGFNEELWSEIGIKSYVEDGKSYLEFTFNVPCNTFYAMYYLSSGMFQPVPAEFIEDLGKASKGAEGTFADGVAAWGKFTDNGLSIVDTWLATGPYVVEAWEKDVQIVFGKNDNYTHGGADRYKMEGVHMRIIAAALTDSLAIFNEFMAGHLHSCGLPKDKLNEYKSDPRTTTTVGDSTFKLNFNTASQEYWIYLFGENGTITQTAKEDYWVCEPAMQNENFLNGLSYAFDRKTLATTLGRTPSSNYFGSSYLSDPENGVMYNDTQTHKDVMNALMSGTDGYGYNLEKARASFKKASEELIASGAYKAGDTFTIEMAWMEQTDIDDFGAIAQNWEDAFNSCGGELKLKVNHWVGQTWSDVYYVKMLLGQYDIGFGSISGNTLNPLNFMEVLKSDNSSGFTLNWGADTSVISEDLFYDGVYWSYDGLWQAADTGAYFENGKVVSAFSAPQVIDVTDANTFKTNEDGSVTFTIPVSIAEVDGVEITMDDAVIFGYIGEGPDYAEDSCGEGKVSITKDEEGKSYVVCTFSADLYTKYSAAVNELGRLGIDLYYTQTTLGVGASSFSSVFFTWPSAEAAE